MDQIEPSEDLQVFNHAQRVYKHMATGIVRGFLDLKGETDADVLAM